ncbi:protein OCTOPUS-like [Aristolochia californica]|uniref:protein OCTOPUS-like n=1 Tax=Aristolochia californica TaxID=171875 RepID=UPI0035DE9717
MTTLEPSRFTACERHPDQHFTGFCAACLRERLAGLDRLQDTRRKSTSSTNPLKAIFRAGDPWNKASSSGSFFPELRRCKSFSGPRAETFSGVFEPQRRSCDVRGRSTLSSLFHQDDEYKTGKEVLGEIEVDTRKVGFANISEPEIRVSEPLVAEEFHEIQEAEEEVEEEGEIEEEETKTIKDHIDLDSMRKSEKTDKEKRDLKEIAGSFWVAASVFSKKWQKWRRKQKIKKSRDKSTPGESEKPTLSSRRFRESRYRETQSEVADYGYGRRSCDTDPRFSLDAGRISFDDARYSFDEPRASWDGHLIGARVPRLPPMLSVLEDAPAPVPRSDTHIPVEEARNSISEDPMTPGGTLQTREYYSDSSSSSRRRKNLERSGSVRKVAEIDETKSVSNSKVSPAAVDSINGSKLSGPSIDRESKDSNSNSNSLRDDCWESFDSVYRDATGVQTKSKKSRRWSMAWSIWGLIHRRNKDDDDERSCRASVIDRSFSESWPELRRDVNGDPRGAFNRKVFRSNSCVSSRGSYNNGGSAFGSTRKSSAETNGHSKKKREEFVLERNRSARYSPSHFDNGLLRFYLTPLRSSRRNVIGVSGKSRSKSSHSFARSVLRLY